MHDKNLIAEFRADIGRAIETMKRVDGAFARMQRAPDEPTSADRLEAIWNKTFGFMSAKRLLALNTWAQNEIGYTYYGGMQKHPQDLCEYIRDHLRDLNEKRLTELEAILK